MRYKFQYDSEDERQSLLLSNSNNVLVEEQSLIDGNFMIFEDGESYSKTLAELEGQLIITQEAIDFLIMGGM